jgi:hypothetical protein
MAVATGFLSHSRTRLRDARCRPSHGRHDQPRHAKRSSIAAPAPAPEAARDQRSAAWVLDGSWRLRRGLLCDRSPRCCGSSIRGPFVSVTQRPKGHLLGTAAWLSAWDALIGRSGRSCCVPFGRSPGHRSPGYVSPITPDADRSAAPCAGTTACPRRCGRQPR